MGELFIDPVLDIPSLQLRLSPQYHSHGDDSNPTSIHVFMTITTRPGRFTSTAPFLTLPLNRGPTETARYDGNAISASTSSGKALPLRYEDEKDGADKIRKWYLDSTVLETDIIVEFVAFPRKTDKYTPTGPRIDLRTDVNGGLIGMGEGFIPVVPEESANKTDNTSKEWNVGIEWDLQCSPPGTRCAWSFGDGPRQKHRGSLDETITHAIFAVGQLKRYPEWTSELHPQTKQREFAMYWFGQPFLDMTTLPPSTEVIFNAIASFFSSTKPFRVFLRQVHTIYGGTGATDSYLLEYSLPAKDEITDDSMAELLAHETIHEYTVLEPAKSLPDGQEEPEETWYTEGIANYYAIIATFRGGAMSRRQLLKSLNGYAQAYYTSPTLHMDYGDALRRSWENVHITRLSYVRGFMYLVAEKARIEAATKGSKSLDDVALQLYRRQLSNKSHSISDYRVVVADIYGKEEEAKNYSAMYRGDLIVPPSDCFADLGLKLIRSDAEKFELGFDSRPMAQDHVIRNLVKGTRAHQAGVLEGDEVMESWMAWELLIT